MTKRVAVIGAGCTGLAAVKCCLEEGLEPVCFESSSDVGGLWRFTENVTDSRGCVMKTTVINTSKEMMSFSDFPAPREFPNFMHHSKVLEYYRLYADRFNLLTYINFNTQVISIKPNLATKQPHRHNTPMAGGKQTSSQILSPEAAKQIKRKQHSATSKTDDIRLWEVEIQDHLATRKEYFDFVLICTGHHADVHMPYFPGQAIFQGKIVHSRDLRDADQVSGTRHVVVGIGNSGCDAAVELSRHGQVFLSTRRGTWLMHRLLGRGLPADISYMSRFIFATALSLPHFMLNKLASWNLDQKVDHTLYGLRPKHGPFATHPTVNDELPNRIASGHVVIKTNIESFTATGIHFEDGSVEENIDTVVMATGYRIGFPFLDESVMKVEGNHTQLYLHMFPPSTHPPSLAVIGCVQPGGAIGPISEMQCRLAARVFKGELELPAQKEMIKDITKERELLLKRFIKTQRHTVQVDYVPYMDRLANLIGCKPKWGALLSSDPYLALVCIFGPCTSYQYRLFGPGTWPGARDAILTQMERVRFPFHSKRLENQNCLGISAAIVGTLLLGCLVVACGCNIAVGSIKRFNF
ncbi:flavin-containing monooxygenase 5-like [Physella acuta]|uniref:flavin-containing monooxygenase 5-like n=1 Tax=Physella acuta TaxID=109671 RepID=UPI0027DDAAFC|nr:flavin-containing monooxygenase 5-like [Physella acuta]